MYSYKCPRCNKLFSQKSDIRKHLVQRKTMCRIVDQTNNGVDKDEFQCPYCLKHFSNKSNLTSHMRQFCRAIIKNKLADSTALEINFDIFKVKVPRKRSSRTNITSPISASASAPVSAPVSPTISEEEEIDYEDCHQCIFCDKTFARKDSLNRHVEKFCKDKPIEDTDEDDDTSLAKRLLELEQQIAALRSPQNVGSSTTNVVNTVNSNSTNNSNNSNINSNNNVQNNVNIKLVAYGQEDLSGIKDSIMKKILSKGFESVPELIKYIHFNKDRPEHHNVYISNKKDEFAQIFNGNKWVTVTKDSLISELITDRSGFLEMKMGDLYEDLDQKIIDKMERFLETQEEDLVQKNLRTTLKLLLYNRKNITEQTMAAIKAQEKQLAKQRSAQMRAEKQQSLQQKREMKRLT